MRRNDGRMKSGCVFVQLHQAILKRGELEEIILLGDQFPGAAADRAVGGLLGIGDVEIVVDAVAALVEILVDVTGVARLQKQPPHGAQVLERRGADEVRVADAELVPQAAKNGRVAVHQLARRDAELGGGASDIFAVLVGAGEERHVVALHALEARDGIGHQRGVGRADVRPRVGVVNRRGQIVFRTRINVTQGRSATVRRKRNG